MKEKIPNIIKQIGFDFDWDNKKVWQLNVSVTEIDIQELIWHFDLPFHRDGREKYKVKSWDIINYPDKHKEEYDRVMKVNLKYPIDIMKNKGRWLILDGLHRLIKSYIQGTKRIKVRIIPRTMISKILRDDK